MCISFFYIGDNLVAQNSSKYQLIIANNRDEYYTRPTLPADFWPDFPHIVSGIDQKKGREGGTWIGASKFGRVAMLLNIFTPEGSSPDKLGRGHFVINYLNGALDGDDYIKEIIPNHDKYKRFNLLLFQNSGSCWRGYYFANNDECVAQEIYPGIYGISNTVIDEPFQKVRYGQRRFEKIVEQYNDVSRRDELVNHILSLMTDKTRNLPDPQLVKQGGQRLRGVVPHMSAVYMEAKEIQCGTRTTTLVLVDKDGQCEYIERTMREPIDADNPEWHITRHVFNMEVSTPCQKQESTFCQHQRLG